MPLPCAHFTSSFLSLTGTMLRRRWKRSWYTLQLRHQSRADTFDPSGSVRTKRLAVQIRRQRRRNRRKRRRRRDSEEKWMCSKSTNRWADWDPVPEWRNRADITRWRRKSVSTPPQISTWASLTRLRLLPRRQRLPRGQTEFRLRRRRRRRRLASSASKRNTTNRRRSRKMPEPSAEAAEECSTPSDRTCSTALRRPLRRRPASIPPTAAAAVVSKSKANLTWPAVLIAGPALHQGRLSTCFLLRKPGAIHLLHRRRRPSRSKTVSDVSPVTWCDASCCAVTLVTTPQGSILFFFLTQSEGTGDDYSFTTR